MTKIQLLAAGTFLAFALMGTGASAQTLNSPTPDSSRTPPVQANFDPAEPAIMVTRSNLTGGFRAPRQGDNDVGVIPISRFRAAGGTDEDFYAIAQENKTACALSGSWIARATAQAVEAHALGGEWVGIREELVDMSLQLNRAARVRTGSNVISSVSLCALSLGWYCGAAIANGVSNEVSGRANTNQAQLNVRQSDLNARQSILNVGQMVLFTDMAIGWSQMIQGYCLTYQVDATVSRLPPVS